MIEQAKFKAFEKTIRNNSRSRRKTKKVLDQHGKQLVKSDDEKDSLKLLKQTKNFDELTNERMDVYKLMCIQCIN